MAFDPIRPDSQPNQPTPAQSQSTPPQPVTAPTPSGIGAPTSQAANVGEQAVRTMRADLGAPGTLGAPAFDSEEPAFTPETTNATQVHSVDQIINEGKQGHTWWLVGGIGGFVVLALVGYFVVYPLLQKTDVASEPPVVNPTPTPTPTPPVTATHTSLFINAPAGTTTHTVTVASNGALNPAEIKGAFVSAASTARSGVTEIVFLGVKGEHVSFGNVLLALAPELATNNPSTLLKSDGTIFIYKDTTGAWPGYVSEFAPGVSSDAMTSLSQKLEKIKLSNFFIVDPGTLSAFKSGTINGVADRYAPGTTAGASFGYLTTKNRLLISTSYSGMKEALRLMGL